MKLLVFLIAAVFVVRTAGAEMVVNSTFENGNNYPWNYFNESLSDSIKLKNFSSGVDLCFIIRNGGTEKWHIEAAHPVALRPGYRYTLSLSGTSLDNENKHVFIGIGHNGSATMGNPDPDYSLYTGSTISLPKNSYIEYKKTWENNSIEDKYARLYIHGGGDTIDFSIAWVYLIETPIETSDTALHVNTVGYFTQGSKRAIVRGVTSDSFSIRNSTGTIYKGILGVPSLWLPTGETVRIADFSAVNAPGSCTLYCADNTLTADFSVSDTALKSLGKMVLKAFYYQRASTELTSEYAGEWKRKAGHPDTQIPIGIGGLPRISSQKGWYDGTYYDKQIVSSGITVYTILSLYEHFPSFVNRCSLKIPESNNTTPDLLDEVRWNLEWMLTMQAPDGGVYSKVSSKQNDSLKMPDLCHEWRYALQKTTPASLDFAAVMAGSSRLYKTVDSLFAVKCLDAALKGYQWATANPTIKFEQPAGCYTRQYSDEQFSDEFFWASAELALATGSSDYTYHLNNPIPASNIPSWKDVATLGLYTIATNMHAFPSALVEKCTKHILATADTLLERQKTGYGLSMADADFQEGSNGIAASQGVLLLFAYYISKNVKYRTGAEQQIDYLLGRNSFNRCFVTGVNGNSPFKPHHLISEAYYLIAPVPGLLVGGSNTLGTDISTCNYNYVNKPGNSWYDRYCSFATNDVSILYNAPLAYCCNALEALYEGDTLNGFRSGTTGNASSKVAAAKNELISVTQYGKNLQLRISMPSSGTTTFRCRIINPLGKVLADFSSYPGKDKHDIFETSFPIENLGRGCVVLLIRHGNANFEKMFILH